MTGYQSEIFDFLTTRSNFDSFVKVIGHYEAVRKELLERFWNSVAIELRSKVEGSSWKVDLGHIFPRYSKLQLYKTEWKRAQVTPLFAVTWESLTYRPYRGLLVHSDLAGFDMSAVRSATIRFKPDHFSTDNNKYWAWWRNADFDFNEAEALSRILPDSYKELANEWATELYEIAMEKEKELDAIADQTFTIPPPVV